MKIIDLEQRTEEWLAWKRDGIGASDISILMGSHPNKTPISLYHEKLGEQPIYVNDAMKNGIMEEPNARNWLSREFSIELLSSCAQDDEFPFMRCSFDAINKEGNWIAEIKTPYHIVRLNEMMQNVPLMHIHQCQWQMMIADLDSIILCLWDHQNQQGFTHLIEADRKLWEKMRKVAHQFWEDLRRGIPPQLTSKDHVDLSEEFMQLKEDVEAYKAAKDLHYKTSQVIKEIEKKLDGAANGRNAILYGVKLTRCDPRVSYDIESMKKAGIPVDSYKKTGNSYYKRTII